MSETLKSKKNEVPEDRIDLRCPSCGAGAENIELLNVGLTTSKCYYKCVLCDYVFAEP